MSGIMMSRIMVSGITMRALEAWCVTYALHSLWQVPLFCVTALVAARVLRDAGAPVQHRVWVLASVCEAIVPGVPIPSRERLGGWLAALLGQAGGGRGEVSVRLGAGHAATPVLLAPRLVAAAAWLYGLLWLYFLLRLVWRSLQVQRLRSGALPVTLSAEAAEVWARCCAGLAVQRATVASSEAIAVPVALGVRHRMVLLPAGLADVLPAAEMATIFAHECAHIRRGDFAKNLLYELLALPIAYHPLYWLTWERLVESREWICDELAAELVAGEKTFAQSLLRLASLLLAAPPVTVPHAIGIFDANALERRVMRLTQRKVQMSGAQRLVAMALCAVMGAGACGSAWALGGRLPTVGTQAETAAGNDPPVHIPAEQMSGNLLTKVPPVYPEEAKEAGVEGAVVLDAVIGRNGELEALKLLSGPPELTKSAWAAVTQWVWKPYLLNGEPTRVKTTITLNYRLQH